MLKKAKEVIVSADSRTKGILAVACFYLVVMFATVTTGAVNHIADFIPTVDITLQDGVAEEKEYLVKQDIVSNVLKEVNVELNKGDTVNKFHIKQLKKEAEDGVVVLFKKDKMV